MTYARNWMASLILRLPASVRSFRRVPVLGSFLHTLSPRVLSSDRKVWAQVEAGPAEGIWFELNPRTGQNYRLDETEKICQAVVAEKLQSGDVFHGLGANRSFFRFSLYESSGLPEKFSASAPTFRQRNVCAGMLVGMAFRTSLSFTWGYGLPAAL